jgi:glutamate/aspartate transport system substrate-binding protein
MDLCHIITDGIMKKVEKSIKINLVPVSNTSRLPLIANGTIDIECGNTTNNLDRQKIASFSNTIYLTASTFMSRAGDGVRTIADLAKRRVSSPAGSTNIEQLYRENKNRSLSISVLPAKDNAEGFLMLESHRIDAFVQDDIVLAGVIATSKAPSEYTISTDRFSEPEPYGLTLPRGDVIFKSMVDGILSDYFQSPAGVETYNKWFTSSIPYKNINLNTPMSTELKNAYNHPSDQAGPGSYRYSSDPSVNLCVGRDLACYE